MTSAFCKLTTLIARLDRLISSQLDCLLHHPQLQALESAWRCLYLLMSEATAASKVKLKLLDIRFDEMARDLDRALEYEHSYLYCKIHSDEFDHAGGEPFGLLLGNYQIDPKRSRQLDTLQKLSQITSSAFAPFICAATPALTQPEQADAEMAVALQDGNQQPEYPALQQLRIDANSRFLAMAVPCIALRSPWGKQHSVSGNLYYQERNRQLSDYLWGNASFAVAAALIREFDCSGWFAEARSIGCYAPVMAYNEYGLAQPLHTDVIVTERRQRVLMSMGFISLVTRWNSASEFPAMPSLYAATGAGNVENAAIQLASQLPMMLCASRFAHCIKFMMREKIGCLFSADDCERHIDNWLRQYTIASSGSDAATVARFPLQAANASVTEDRSQPGRYWCTISLTPHHRFDGVDAMIRLTSELVRVAA